ncbi:MAG TPA: PA2169 family four-helix-bundle protein [Ilumatobacteraceae bacterium]|nr:PA2169 family four-helix-bundle protein [Ilumatobacteraceae bacterium]HRB03830.1 PA2169 family four-helix-bundle protein [Ilumatobacteraceae bacterium]
MSVDETVTQDLIKTLENGREGFQRAAEKLADSNEPALAAEFTTFSEQRGRFASELTAMAASYGDPVDKRSTLPGALHRGWMAVKDMLSGSDASGVLDAAAQGEDHAVEEYETALKADISDGLRTVVNRQFADVKAARDRVQAARNHANATK